MTHLRLCVNVSSSNFGSVPPAISPTGNFLVPHWIQKVRGVAEYRHGKLCLTPSLLLSCPPDCTPPSRSMPTYRKASLPVLQPHFTTSLQRPCHGFCHPVNCIHYADIGRVCMDGVEPCVPTPSQSRQLSAPRVCSGGQVLLLYPSSRLPLTETSASLMEWG
jgi:hypothetical protein